jgi:hypothetical protein
MNTGGIMDLRRLKILNRIKIGGSWLERLWC